MMVKYLCRFLVAVLAIVAALNHVQAQLPSSPVLAKVVTGERQLVFGEILRENDTHIELFDLSTGNTTIFQKETLTSFRKDAADSEAAYSIGLAKLLAWRVKQYMPAVSKGSVAKVDGPTIYVTFGSESGISNGQELFVYRGAGEIKDPVTGEVLGSQRRRIARLVATETRERYCKAKLQGDLEIALQVGDEVEPTTLKNAIAVLPLLTPDGQETTQGNELSAEIKISLVESGLTVVERDQVAAVLSELLLQQTEFFDPKQAQNVGKQVGASVVLTGTISQKGRAVSVRASLIEVGTGKIKYASSLRVKATDLVPLGRPVRNVAPRSGGSRPGRGAVQVYWTDVEGGTNSSMRCLNEDGSVSTVLTGLSHPRGMALDMQRGKMYWTDGGTHTIRRANLDGSDSDSPVPSDNTGSGVAINTKGGKIYWTIGGKPSVNDGAIRRANLDGSAMETVVGNLFHPVPVALDVQRGHVYWSDIITNKIQRANLDGSNVVDVLTGILGAHGLDIDVSGGKLYWTAGKAIRRANLDGSHLEDLVVSGLHGAVTLSLDLSGGKIYWADADNANVSTSRIQRANLDGSNVETLMSGVGFPWGIAVGR